MRIINAAEDNALQRSPPNIPTDIDLCRALSVRGTQAARFHCVTNTLVIHLFLSLTALIPPIMATEQLRKVAELLLEVVNVNKDCEETSDSSDFGSQVSSETVSESESNLFEETDDVNDGNIEYELDCNLSNEIWKGKVLENIEKHNLKAYASDLGVRIGVPLRLRSSNENSFVIQCKHASYRKHRNVKNNSRPNQSRYCTECKMFIRGFKRKLDITLPIS